jgi:hypothetical protein
MNNTVPALFPEVGGSDDGWLPENTGPGGLNGDNITPGSVDIIVGGEYPKCGIVVLLRPPMYVRSWPVVPLAGPATSQRSRISERQLFGRHRTFLW